jgi:TPR repeat protein
MPAAEAAGSGAKGPITRASCPPDDAKACFEWAKRLEQGSHGAPLDRAGAAAAYRTACERGHADACNSAGELTFFGDGPVAPNRAQGAREIEQACKLGSIQGCTNLGFIYTSGQGLTANEGQAAIAHQRALSLSVGACEAGNALSCSIAGNIYGSGRPGVDKDAGKATAAYRAAAAHAKAWCDAERASDCVLLAALYDQGTGVPSDKTMAANLLRRACDAGELAACTDLGLKLVPVEADAHFDGSESVALYSKACDGADARGCFLLALSYAEGPRRDMSIAAALYKKACDRAHSGACVNLGRLHSKGEAGLPRDATIALALYEQGCNRGDPAGCKNLSVMRRDQEQQEFRQNLKIGDTSHCGLVTEVNPPIVRVQAMVGMYWMKVDQLYPAGQQRCSFYNGLYQDPS